MIDKKTMFRQDATGAIRCAIAVVMEMYGADKPHARDCKCDGCLVVMHLVSAVSLMWGKPPPASLRDLQ